MFACPNSDEFGYVANSRSISATAARKLAAAMKKFVCCDTSG